MRESVLWERAVLESAGVHVDDHVHHGYGVVLPGYVPVVYHLEHGVQRVCAVWEQFGQEEDGQFAILLYRVQELCAGVCA